MKRAVFVGVLAFVLSGGVLMAQSHDSRSTSNAATVRTAIWNNGAAVVQPVRDHDRDRDDWRAYDRGRVYRVYPYTYNYPYTYTNPYYSYPYNYTYSPYNYGYSYPNVAPYTYAPYGYGGYGYGYYGRGYGHFRHEEHERLEHERHERHEHRH